MTRKVGVIGAGFGTQVHVPGFRSEGWEVPALFSRNPDRARNAAESAGIPDVYSDAMELIARDDLDAIAIATPPGQHHDLAIAALKSGKHVLCEKPFALDAKQAEEMYQAAQESGLTAMVAHEFRHTPQRAFIKEQIESGYVGDFQLCNIELFFSRGVPAEPPTMAWAHRSSEGGGYLGAIGSHYIDGLRYWFGDVKSARGDLMTVRPDVRDDATGELTEASTDDTFTFTLTFTNGGMATMTASTAFTPSRGARISVMGTEGMLYAEQAGHNPAEDGQTSGSRKGEPLQQLETPARLMPFSDERDPRLMAFRLLVRDFNRGIEEGTSPNPNFGDAMKCQQVLDAIRESAKTGSVVSLA